MNLDREQIRAWIEAATGEGLSVSDALPDTLACTAEAIGLEPGELRMWVFDHSLVRLDGTPSGLSLLPPSEWTAAALVAWARRYELARTPAG